jgi:hypothetical protein
MRAVRRVRVHCTKPIESRSVGLRHAPDCKCTAHNRWIVSLAAISRGSWPVGRRLAPIRGCSAGATGPFRPGVPVGCPARRGIPRLHPAARIWTPRLAPRRGPAGPAGAGRLFRNTFWLTTLALPTRVSGLCDKAAADRRDLADR